MSRTHKHALMSKKPHYSMDNTIIEREELTQRGLDKIQRIIETAG